MGLFWDYLCKTTLAEKCEDWRGYKNIKLQYRAACNMENKYVNRISETYDYYQKKDYPTCIAYVRATIEDPSDDVEPEEFVYRGNRLCSHFSPTHACTCNNCPMSENNRIYVSCSNQHKQLREKKNAYWDAIMKKRIAQHTK